MLENESAWPGRVRKGDVLEFDVAIHQWKFGSALQEDEQLSVTVPTVDSLNIYNNNWCVLLY